MATKTNAMQKRYAELLKGKSTHPSVRWVSLGQISGKPECKNLNGRVFSLEDPRLSELVFDHGKCGCRLSPQRGS